MTPGEFREYARTMCEFGIVRLKMKDVHIIIKEIPLLQSSPLTSGPATFPPASGMGDPDPIQHNIEQVASLLKLSDTELVDRMFPDRTNTEVSER